MWNTKRNDDKTSLSLALVLALSVRTCARVRVTEHKCFACESVESISNSLVYYLNEESDKNKARSHVCVCVCSHMCASDLSFPEMKVLILISDFIIGGIQLTSSSKWLHFSRVQTMNRNYSNRVCIRSEWIWSCEKWERSNCSSSLAFAISILFPTIPTPTPSPPPLQSSSSKLLSSPMKTRTQD